MHFILQQESQPKAARSQMSPSMLVSWISPVSALNEKQKMEHVRITPNFRKKWISSDTHAMSYPDV